MSIRLALFLFVLAFATVSFGQSYPLSGQVTESESKIPLFGVNVVIGNVGTVTDIDGKYAIDLKPGTYKVLFDYIGFNEITEEITITDGPLTLDVVLGGSEVLNEVIVTADIAIERETPVAFTNIPTRKIQEELASQDIPLLLNSTPGAYATNAGGGDGDARVSIRGFDQRNIAVMLDGIPVNDMENGRVFWSNWFGLDLVTKTMQVQRGLGASKIALPSLGGTINILTQGIESRRKFSFKQEYGNNSFSRSTIGYNSGRLQNGWGFSLAGSYKRGNGWVDETWTEGYFYYLRLDKEFKRHLISISGFGAPQSHGQRSFTTEIARVDENLAADLGVETDQMPVLRDFGRRYNQHWGFLDRYQIVDGDTISNGVERLNVRQNYYHKPQISLRHSWTASDKLFIANNLYMSIGRGGGIGGEDTPGTIDDPNAIDFGQRDLQSIYDFNRSTGFIRPEPRSENILRASVNNHIWYGMLSTFRLNLSPVLNLSGGVDLRYYEGDHYRKVHDLLGGEFFQSPTNAQTDPGTKLVEGDKYLYDDTGFVRWGGLFGLLEYKKNNWSAFVNLSGATVGYRLVNYFKPEIVNLADTSFFVSFDKPVDYNGTTYTIDSPEAEFQEVGWAGKNSITFKTGANYRFDKHHNAFLNLGYLSRPTRFDNVINNRRFSDLPVVLFDNSQNEIVYALELGYGFKSTMFSGNVNGYFMTWDNKPLDSAPTILEDPTDPDSERIPVNINGIAARHMGIEMDFAFKPIKMVTIEGLASVGDWIWNSSSETTLQDGTTYTFDASGVHVGDQAQLQFGGLIRIEPIDGLYFKLKGTYFGKHFANFNPESLRGANGGRESWKAPDYFLVDLHAGYNFTVSEVRMAIRFNVLNLLDEVYISDAVNNNQFNAPAFTDFDAKSAAVFFGQGIRFNTSFQLSF